MRVGEMRVGEIRLTPYMDTYSFSTYRRLAVDQYRWVNNAVRKLPKREPAIKKTYFVADTPNGPCCEFMKHSYELIPSRGYICAHPLPWK